ncbi:sulfite exporter TauE/SafE family protein [Petropleomorpha daqingensis]|uniref:Probable membrane transporter protein n=1 Tax=Petropleomorpha daqingensis TaxID=2026353 RepID=A0A853CP60_9ACTN|nr:hypothetical protein [Petropleomorpha daqingensis]
MAAAELAFLVVAGLVAGVLGTGGGITSLVSYPALLAVGLPPLTADVANLVALVACWPGSALTSRRELAGSGRWLARGLPLAAVGAAGGAVLLLTTPSGLFERLVPFLLAVGSLALLAQPVLTRRWHARRGQALALPIVTAVSVYSGYFGAGAGVLLLATLLVLVDERLPEANAVKNMLNGAATVAAAVVLVVAGPVDWAAVVPLAAGLFAGALLGPVVVRHLPATVVRVAVAALGLGLAVELAFR